MATTTQGIVIPIQAEITNLQKVINELQSKLSNLKVGSSGFKAMDSALRTAQRELDKLYKLASRPIIEAKSFNVAENSISKLESELEGMALNVNRIKFSDLQLDASQEAQLKSFKQQIDEIQNSIKKTKEVAQEGFLGSDAGKAWSAIDPTATSKSLDQITNNIRTAVLKQKTELDKAKQVLEDYTKQAQLNASLEASLKSNNPLEKLMKPEQFNAFFSTGKDGALKFKTGQKPIFEQWLQDNFEIDPSIIQNLMKNSADKIQKELARADSDIRKALEGQIQSNNTKKDEASKNVTVQENKFNTLQSYLTEATNKQKEATTSAEQYRTKIDEIGQAQTKYERALVQSYQAQSSFSNGIKKAASDIDHTRESISLATAEFLKQQRVLSSFNSMKMAVINFMGFNQVLNLTKTAVREAMNHIRELDAVMNGISIVTDMSTDDLWNQVDAYTQMAANFGVSIKGAYEVSQIYYQQGLETNDVLTLTNETLKLAKISGLDYAATTDYMTTALRGFKMEMSEASTVVDVYSNLAANTAVSQEELAVAMSKTASSMQNVGSTFEETSAMIGTMVAVTRESATNIGSAMKSIASRYGELTKDPTKLVDEEGEAMAFNKVDAALQSVGISMKTVDGQFRDFTDVILDLSEKWDQLDSTQQRYIATQFAGNRQQSRFLALVGNVDLLKSNLDVAMNSEDTGTLQALKALDSIETKTEQVRLAYQQFYTTVGAQDLWKGALDGITRYITNLNSLPKLFNKVPLSAVAMISNLVGLIKMLGQQMIKGIAKIWQDILPKDALGGQFVQSMTEAGKQAGDSMGNSFVEALTAKTSAVTQATQVLTNAAAQGIQTAETDKTQAASKPPATTQTVDTTIIAKSKEALESQINSLNLSETINQQFATIDIHGENLTNQIIQAIQNTIAAAGAQGQQLKEVLANASDEALNGYINSLLGGKVELQNIGADLSKSLAEGMRASEGEAKAAATEMGEGVIEATRTALDTHSPSPIFINIGQEGVGGGLAEGIRASITDVENAAKELGATVPETLKEALQKGGTIDLTSYFDEKTAKNIASKLEAKVAQEEKQVQKKAHTPTETKLDKEEIALIQAKITALNKLKEARIQVQEATKNKASKEEKSKANDIKREATQEVVALGYAANLNQAQIDKKIQDLNQQLQANPLQPVVAVSTEEVASAADQAVETIKEHLSLPELEVSLNNIFNLETGDVLDDTGIEEFLSQLQEAGKISEETKQALLECYNVKPPEDFIQMYNEVAEQIKETFSAPELGASLNEVFNLDTGEAIDSTGIEELLSKLEEAGKISAETKAALLDCYETKPSEEFLQMYSDATNTEGIIADSNLRVQAAKEVATAEQAAAQATVQNAQSTQQSAQASKEKAQADQKAAQAAKESAEAARKEAEQKAAAARAVAGNWTRGAGQLLAGISGLVDRTTEAGAVAANTLQLLGGTANLVGSLLSKAGPMAYVSAAITIISSFVQFFQNNSLEARIDRAQKQAEQLTNAAKQEKANYNLLSKSATKLDELKAKRYESAEASEEYQAAVDELAEKFPELISSFDEAGNAIIETSNMENVLSEARKKSAQATYDAALKEKEASELQRQQAKEQLQKSLEQFESSFDQTVVDNSVAAHEYDRHVSINRGFFTDADGELNQLGQALINGSDASKYALTNTAQLIDDAPGHYSIEQSIAQLLANTADWQWFGIPQELLSSTLLEDESRVNWEELLKKGYEKRNSASGLSEVEAELLAIAEQATVERKDSDELDQTSQDAKKLLEDVQTLKNAIAEGINYEEFSEKYTNLKTKFEALAKGEEGPLADAANDALTALEGVSTAMMQYSAQVAIDAKNAKTITNAYIIKERGAQSAFASNTGLVGIATSLVDNLWQTDEVYKNLTFTDFISADKGGTQVDEILNAAQMFYDRLNGQFLSTGESYQAAFARMSADVDHYTFEDIVSALNLTEADPFYEELKSYYNDIATNLKTNLINNLNTKISFNKRGNTNLITLRDYVDKLDRSLSSVDSQFFNLAANQIDSLEKQGWGNQATQFTNAIVALDGVLQNVDEATRNTILDTIKENGITTAEGIAKVRSTIDSQKNNGLITAEVEQALNAGLTNAENALVKNIALSIQSITSDFLEGWKDTSKSAEKLTSGVDVTELQSIIDEAAAFNFTLTREDFFWSDGSLITTSEKANEYWQALTAYNKGLATSYQTDLDSAKDVLKLDENGKIGFANLANSSDQAWKDAFTVNQEFREALSTIFGAGLSNYFQRDESGTVQYDKNGNALLDINKIPELREKIAETYQNDIETLNKYQQMLNDIEQQALKESQWKKGDFSSLASGLAYKGWSNEAIKNRLEMLARGLTTTEVEDQDPEVQAAVEYVQNQWEKEVSKYTSRANALADTLGELNNVSKGQKVTGELKEILSSLDMVDSNGIVTSTTRLVEAYERIYSKMVSTAHATTAQLNEAYAAFQTEKYSKNNDILTALGNGFDFSSLGELLSKHDILLQDALTNQLAYGLNVDNFGNIRIADWTSFATKVFGDNLKEVEKTPEYLDAFKQYNESLIELNNQTKTHIKDEVNAIISAQGGDAIDISWLEEEFGAERLNEIFNKYGAALHNGILSLDENQANVPAIVSELIHELRNAGEESVQLTSNELAELQDALDGLLSGAIELITKGASGSLTNVDRNALVNWAKQNKNITEALDFTQTADGIKLTEDSFYKLYKSVKDINVLSAKKLLPTLKNMSKSYETLTGAQKEYHKALEEGNREKASAIADVIGEYLRQSPDAYNLFKGETPLEAQKAKNIIESTASATKTVTVAQKTGKLGFEDFYGIFGELESQLGSDFEINGKTIADIIGFAPGAYDYDENNGAVVNLTQLGFKSAKDWAALKAALQAAAEARKAAGLALEQQAETLNGASKDKSIDWTKIFTPDGFNKDALKDASDNNDALKATLDQFVINNKSLLESVDELPKSLLSSIVARVKQGNFTVAELQDQIIEALGLDAENISLSVNEDGKINLNFEVKDEQIVPSLKVHGQTLTGDALAKYQEIAAANAEKFTTNSTSEGFDLSYQVNGVTIKWQYNADKKTYTYTYGNYSAPTEEELISLLVEFGEINDSSEPKTISIDDTTRTYVVKGTQYNVAISGENITITSEDGKPVAEDVRASIEAAFTNVKANINASGTGADVTTKVDADTKMADDKWSALKKTIEENPLIAQVTANLESFISAIRDLKIEKEVSVKYKPSEFIPTPEVKLEDGVATAMGTALAGGRKGKTLMGELGPELYVTNGKYYIAGQNGAEFVNLPDDAIVFNHLQTKKLLDKGYTTNGKPFTSEGKAVGQAHAAGKLYSAVKQKSSSQLQNKTNVAYTAALKAIANQFQQVSNRSTEAKQAVNEIKATLKNKDLSKEQKAEKQAQIQTLNKEAQKLDKIIKKELATPGDKLNNAGDKLNDAAENQNAAADATKKSLRQISATDSKMLHDNYGTIRKSVSPEALAKLGLGQGTPGAATASSISRRKSPVTSATLPLGFDLASIAKSFGGGKKGTTEEALIKQAKELQSVIQSVLQDVISNGFENIDLSTYEKLPKDIKNQMQAYIDNSDASYPEFIRAYMDVAGYGIKEGNALVFEAYQKQFENEGISQEIQSALGELSFFNNGTIAGSDETWTTLFGEYTDLTELIDAGVITYNEELQQWVATSVEALQQFHTNLEAINDFEAVQADSLRKNLNDIVDLLSKAESGSITNKEFTTLNTYLKANGLEEISKEFLTSTADGLVLSYKVLAQKYQEAIDKNLSPETVEQLYDLKIKAIEDNNARVRKDTERSMKFTSGAEKDAVDALTFFANDAFAGTLDQLEALANSSEIDLSDILDHATWDSKLQQFVVSNKSAIEGIDWDSIENIGDMVADDINEFFANIVESIRTGLEGGLTHGQATNFTGSLAAVGIDTSKLDFKQGLEGLKLTQESAINLYTQLKEIDEIQAQLTFKELNESLRENNDNYKTMTDILYRIKDLTDKINTSGKYSDEKIRQYKEELSLAKEIAAARATSEDESFNFLDNDIPGAMNNPLNYANNWIDAWKSLRDSAESGVMDFKQLYNIVKEMNTMAATSGQAVNFLGFELDGTTESFDKMITAMSTALGSNDEGVFGVLMSKLGTGLTEGVDQYGKSADNALHTMAETQIKILKSLIQVFEVIVSMEEFDGVDTNLDQVLDINEIFNLDGIAENALETATKFSNSFTAAAQHITQMFTENPEMEEAFKAVKIGNHTFAELIKDAADGVRDITDINLKDYASALSVFYELMKSGDFNVDNIAESLREQLTLHHGDFSGTIEAGDMIINMRYNVKVQRTKDGKYLTEGGQTYDTADAACKAAALEGVKGIEKGSIALDPTTQEATGEIKLTDTTIKVSTDAEQKITYQTPNGESYGSLDAAARAMYKETMGVEKIDDETAFEKWEIQQGIKVIPVIDEVDPSALTQAQINNAIGKTYEEVRSKWEQAQTGENGYDELAFQAEYGIKMTETTTEEDWQRFKELAGIETKNIELNAHINITNKEEINQFLSSVMGGGGAPADTTTTTTHETVNSNTTTADVSQAVEAMNQLAAAQNGVKLSAEEATAAINILGSSTINISTDMTQQALIALRQRAEEAKSAIDTLSNSTVTINVDAAITAMTTLVDKLDTALRDLKDIRAEGDKGPINIDIQKTETTTTTTVAADAGATSAKGTFGNAFAAGSRQTLMGELGPELYVTNGHYYVAGQNGAEFVSLPNDAIVFNHLQTAKLLNTGSAGRGVPVTNERAAVAYARGTTGLAAADAKQTLAALKQMLAMWESLASASITDLAGMANTGDENDTPEGIATWIKQVEKWYNLLQRIAALEKQINKEEATRNLLSSQLVTNGTEYAKSQQRTFEALKQQASLYSILSNSYLDEFNSKRNKLNTDGVVNQLYSINELGQIEYNKNTEVKFLRTRDDGSKYVDTLEGGLAILTELYNTQYENNSIRYNPQEQVALASQLGFDKYMMYDSEGKAITREEKESDSEFAARKLDALKFSLDQNLEELQGYYDSYYEQQAKALNTSAEANKILQEVRDNQIDLENQVLEAIENREQKLIDELQEQKDILESSTSTYMKGLSDALNREKNMYSQSQSDSELATLQRQLGILQRSGGSAGQIASLQKQIDSKMQDSYFNSQQQQIDTLQQSVDAELERLDRQIEIMNTQLEFAKEHGLLWSEALQIMRGDSSAVVGFINAYSTDYMAKSITEQEKIANDLTNAVDQYKVWNAQQYDQLNVKISDIGKSQVLEVHDSGVETAVESNLGQNTEEVAQKNTIDLATKELDRLAAIEREKQAKAAEEQKKQLEQEAAIKKAQEEQEEQQRQAREQQAQEYMAEIATYQRMKDDIYRSTDLKKYEKEAKYQDLDNRIQWLSSLLADLGYENFVGGYYANGGLVNYTGLAMVHGSPSNPEAFLSAPETKMWKQNILGNNGTSLTSQLLDLRNLLNGMENVSSSVTNNAGVNIEKAEVHMEVQQIANDYDARRAGENVMDEMIKIARKTGSNSVRR